MHAPSSSSKQLFLQAIGLFSLVRVVNVSVLMLAQVLTAVFIFSKLDIIPTLRNIELWLIVIATGFSVSGGYIFNAFFDEEKDLINRPQKTILERHVSAKAKLAMYFICSVMALLVAKITHLLCTMDVMLLLVLHFSCLTLNEARRKHFLACIFKNIFKNNRPAFSFSKTKQRKLSMVFLEELSQIIGPNLAKKIYDHLRDENSYLR